MILENHGGGAQERDRVGQASNSVCVEKPAATVGIPCLILMGTLGASVRQVPECHSLGGQGAGVFIIPLLSVTG